MIKKVQVDLFFEGQNQESDSKFSFDSSVIHYERDEKYSSVNDHMHDQFDFSGKPTDYMTFQNRKDEEREHNVQSYIDLRLEKDEFISRLQQAGYSTENESALYIELINSLNLQIQVLEKAIFTKSKSYIYSYDVNFGESTIKNLQGSSHYDNFQGINRILGLKWAQITNEEKLNYLETRKKIDKLKKKIEEFLSLRKNHVCIYCGEEFAKGRQLGGHMSRKHPGSSLNHLKIKKNSHKKLQNKRRKYFQKINKNLGLKKGRSSVKLEEEQ